MLEERLRLLKRRLTVKTYLLYTVYGIVKSLRSSIIYCKVPCFIIFIAHA